MVPRSCPSIIDVLIVGCGNMGISHAKAYAARSDCKIVGIVSRGAESRARLQKAIGRRYPEFSDYFEAMRITRPNLVCISTYPDTHCSYAITAMESGAHVFLEKPIAETLSDAQMVVNCSKKTDRKVLIGYILRQHPSWKRFIEISHELGKPLVMRMNLNQQSCAGEWQTHRNLMKSLSPIVDCGVHYVDIMCQMTRSQPVRVAAIGAKLTEEIPHNMYNYGQLQVTFDDGSVGWYEAGWGPMISLAGALIKDVVGPHGSVSMVSPQVSEDPSDIAGHTKTGSFRRHYSDLNPSGDFSRADEVINMSNEPDHDELCAMEQNVLIEAIKADTNISEHLQDAVNSLKIVLAADQSIKEGRCIYIN